MEELKRSLKERRKYLLKLKTEKNKVIKNGVKGKLRISCHGKRVQYYWRSGPKDVNGTYLKDRSAAQKLAQKEYDTQIIRLAEKEIAVIDKFEKVNINCIIIIIRKFAFVIIGKIIATACPCRRLLIDCVVNQIITDGNAGYS